MKTILLSIILLAGGIYCSFINTQENVYNIMTAYVIISFTLSPFCIVAASVMKEKDLQKIEFLGIKKAFNSLWIAIWIKMILVGWVVTGILGLLAVVAFFMFIQIIEQRLEELREGK